MSKINMIAPEIMRDLRYLAHTRNTGGSRETETLLAHSELTMHYYEVYCEKKGMEEIIKGLIAACGFQGEEEQTVYLLFLYAIYLHDAGKINPRFQYEVLDNGLFKEMCRQARNSHHALASAYLYIDHMYKILLNNPTLAVQKCLASFAYCICKHHGKLDNGHDFSQLETWSERYYKSDLDSSIFENIRYYMQESEVFVSPINFYILCRLLYALITGCDYCAAQEFMTGHAMRPAVIENSGENLKRCYDDSTICRSIRNYQKDPATFSGDPINALRNQLFLEAERNLLAQPEANIYYLEAPTGAGKTNMAVNLTLRVLEMDPNINSVFYVFPFNTLVEQTKKALLPFFNDQLAVINSITPVVMGREERKDKYEAAWLDYIFNNYSIVLTSHVNFFNALFGCGREQCFPLLKLCNSVVILDEIQSYKNSIWREIIGFLQSYAQQLHIKIIMMSATLPQLNQLLRTVDAKFAALVEVPQRYYRHPLFQGRVQLDFSLLEKGEIALEELKEEVLRFRDKRVLVEFIKKKTARQFFELCKEECNAVLLTGDDSAARRDKVIRRIDRGEKLILIATQVIEAGVNIDMEIGFKDISLLDSEEQFLGRINRSCLNAGGAVAYFFDFDDASLIYRGDARLRYSIQDPAIRQNLQEKRFDEIYARVFRDLIDKTSKANRKNLANLYENCAQFNCRNIEEKMRLIERSWQLFIPYVWEELDGYQVWEEFKALGSYKEMGYAQRMVEYSRLALEMSYFTFTVFRDKIPAGAEEYGGYYFIEGGERFIDDGVLNRDELEKYYGGIFL
ncbi:CRISPR-associated helicase Cas3 [Desulfofarcimen acetoxidans DSM 771]|uniref:CRISPR-associated helicase Cas3 n=1 Tax=Desulfofarcimen acetoxidans (strain ATCC 49208 / DSM 771 / KCTC 5769 / VKM B-1644 / 5575) TaxID=485916 RepID=C8W3G9_DESAS|nr:CRISPR-associated helicase/endonuclease Cas3 [Desulfofarcimen acetoxidans]ACV63755.1 CRISPR-associated helicase Cas3 [Desulfofarcimen acetoxidans DSM 771]